MEKVIPFGDGRYSVSISGIIINTITGRELKQNTISTGYKQVKLYHDGLTKNILVHRIIAEAFIDNPNNLPCINHIDNCRSNNNISNLEWITLSGNTQHSYNTGRISIKGNKHGMSILDEIQVKTIKSLKGQLRVASIASYFGVSLSTIYYIYSGKIWNSI